MKKLFFATTALVALVALGPAEAADLSRPVEKAPAIVRTACAQFGGFYVGAHAGANYYGHHWNDLDNYALSNVGINEYGPINAKKTGWHGGIQGGYNWQSGCTVFGIEADYSWTSTTAAHLERHLSSEDFLAYTSRLRGFGTVRARTGLVVDNLLLYVTGGLSYASFERSATFFDNFTNLTEVFSSTRTRWGWTVGVGTEWAMTANWSLKSEFLYMSFENDEQTFACAILCVGLPVGTRYRFEHQDHVWVSRIGINYRFGGAPILAKY